MNDESKTSLLHEKLIEGYSVGTHEFRVKNAEVTILNTIIDATEMGASDAYTNTCSKCLGRNTQLLEAYSNVLCSLYTMRIEGEAAAASALENHNKQMQGMQKVFDENASESKVRSTLPDLIEQERHEHEHEHKEEPQTK